MRTVVAGLVVVGLAVAVFLAWPRGGEDEPPGDATATTMTTTTTTSGTTSTAPPTTAGSHVVTSVDEAEAILRELWFGWFEGIYNQDEDRIREVVANPHQVDAAIDQFGVMEFVTRPSPELLLMSNTEVLLANDACLAVWSVVDAQEIVGASNEGVFVFVWGDNAWKFVASWTYREDRWQDDCQSRL